MAKLLTLPVNGSEETVELDFIEALLMELLGSDFEDTVITDNGRVLYVAETVDAREITNA